MHCNSHDFVGSMSRTKDQRGICLFTTPVNLSVRYLHPKSRWREKNTRSVKKLKAAHNIQIQPAAENKFRYFRKKCLHTFEKSFPKTSIVRCKEIIHSI